MKKVLITGAGSFIGISVENHLVKREYDYQVDTIDMIDDTWREYDFSKYDSVFHVAGIAHSDVGNATEEQKALYYRINTDLAYDTAQKAKADGVKQFIYMSSAIVFGASAPVGVSKIVSKDTPTNPENFYGDSKVQAEIKLDTLRDDKFKVCILRPPMIYGPGSKGNYPLLSKFAKRLPVFPNIDNCRSMIYIENFAEFVRLMIENQEDGTFMPQNEDYTCTSEMVKEIANANGNNIHLTKLFNPALRIMGKKFEVVNKAFGNLAYDKSASVYKENYCICDFKESIRRTENQDTQKKALILASVASMIDLFNADNIDILLDLGYEVHISSNFENGSITSQERVNEYKQELIDRGITVFHTPIPRSISKIGDIIKSYKLVKNLVKNNRYEIVHCHSPIGGVICRLACRKYRKKFGTKVIYTAHGFHFFNGASKVAWLIFYPIEKFCSRFTDLIITINQEDFERAKSFHAKNVEYVPGIGVHTEKFRNTDVDRQIKRSEFGFTDDDFVFMSTGQVSVRKNHEVIIRALSNIDNSNVKYLIVGFGELEEKLKDLVQRLNLKDRVVFAGYRSDINELLHCVDAFAFPSLQEGLPVSLMEAMCVGLPVVCSRIRGNVDLVQDGKNGFLVDRYDVVGFADKMSMLVNDKTLGVSIGENAMKTMDKYSNLKVMKKMYEVYSTIRR